MIESRFTLQGINSVMTTDGKFTKTVGGYILALDKLKSQGFKINEDDIKDVNDMFSVIDKANNERKSKFNEFNRFNEKN